MQDFQQYISPYSEAARGSEFMERSSPGEDRISNLTSDIRLHILSLLPRKFAIRTGTLSTKWLNSWKERFPNSTNLDFGELFTDGKSSKQIVEEINHSLAQCQNKKIETFCLYFYPVHPYKDIMRTWMKKVVESGTEELYLDFSREVVVDRNGFPKKYKLDHLLFSGNSVVVMKLKCCRLRLNFKFQAFGNSLEVLCLDNVEISDCLLVALVSACSVLESLELRNCCLHTVKVSGPQLRLKRLSIIDTLVLEIEVSAPKLTFFQYNGEFPEKFQFGDISSLVDVILIAPRGERCAWGEMFMDFQRIEVLTLCNMALERMYGVSATIETFVSLRELQLLMVDIDDENLLDIFSFFGNHDFPQLENVFIELTNASKLQKNYIEYDSYKPLGLYFSNLKVVKLNNIRTSKNEMMLVSLFLQHAVYLKAMVLVLHHSCLNEEGIYFILAEIRKMMKASAEVQVAILLDDDKKFCARHSELYLDI